MRVLVTGADTALGAAVIAALARTAEIDHVVATAAAARPPLPASVMFEPADLRYTRDVHDLVWQAAARHRIDTVIHLGDSRPCGRDAHGEAVTTRQLVLRCAEHPTIRRFVSRSTADVYASSPAIAGLIDEDAALDFDPAAPAWLRSRVEADVAVTEHLGGALAIAVLRLAEVFAPGAGGALWEYLASRMCLRPLGFDPMINLLALEDAVAALLLAARGRGVGVFNIPGFDSLPLSLAIAEAGRAQLAVPGPVLGALAVLRRRRAGPAFDLPRRRLRVTALMDGTRARRHLGYLPRHPVRWPRAWWQQLFERLAMSS